MFLQDFETRIRVSVLKKYAQLVVRKLNTILSLKFKYNLATIGVNITNEYINLAMINNKKVINLSRYKIVSIDNETVLKQLQTNLDNFMQENNISCAKGALIINSNQVIHKQFNVPIEFDEKDILNEFCLNLENTENFQIEDIYFDFFFKNKADEKKVDFYFTTKDKIYPIEKVFVSNNIKLMMIEIDEFSVYRFNGTT